MITKNKNNQELGDRALNVARQAGLLLMVAATSLGFFHVPEHHEKKALLSEAKPLITFPFESHVEKVHEGRGGEERREREETGPHYTSYSISQRTPARSGLF